MLCGGRDPANHKLRVMVGAVGAVRTHQTNSIWQGKSVSIAVNVSRWYARRWGLGVEFEKISLIGCRILPVSTGGAARRSRQPIMATGGAPRAPL